MQSIDRRRVVDRHRIVLQRADPTQPFSVGNGEFAFAADVTGLQTFPSDYEAHTPLCTQAQWGWHSFPLPAALRGHSLRPAWLDTHGRAVPYNIDPTGQQALFDHLRQNPHRLHLGRIGLQFASGREVRLTDLEKIEQELDLWTGLLTSRFRYDGEEVVVQTCCAGDTDALAVRIRSRLLADGRLSVGMAFPYGLPGPSAADWAKPDAHETLAQPTGKGRIDLTRELDADRYHVSLAWTRPARWEQTSRHTFRLESENTDTLELTARFTPAPEPDDPPTWAQALRASEHLWESYWTSGAAIDFGNCTDARSPELERRVVLSQYLMRVNCAGSLPPAETGLTCNSWYGKFHLEMHWWHGVHFAAWDRLHLLERSLDFYHRILPEARRIAAHQGYAGARWPKMVGPEGVDSPSNVGPLLLWQQPHPIYYAELLHRHGADCTTLERWAMIVEESAEWMASYAWRDPATGRHVLGPPLKTVSENTDALQTRNPCFELVQWRWGLETAQCWRERRGLARRADWDAVIESLAPLPSHDGRYLMQEGMSDTFTTWNWEHPAVVGIRGVLPGTGVDQQMHRRTVQEVMRTWQWDRCWGWDFPMVALAAARAGLPELAVDALFIDSRKNTYGLNGQNYQRAGLSVYLPGNGGLLAAVAMMALGSTDEGQPVRGFPDRGWDVRHERLRPLLGW